ncbi:MAG: adenosine deaminase family protein [Methylococcales bacterium]
MEASEQQLEDNLYESTSPRIGLKNSHKFGFAAYELPGELSGSALLSHPLALEPYIEEVVKQALHEGLNYLELRGSPRKYGDGLDFLKRFDAAVNRSKMAFKQVCLPEIRFIVIGDRRSKPRDVENVVNMTIRAREQFPELIAGLDLAGDERTKNPQELCATFEPAFANCLPLTIHAGEGESADNIWQAAYHLHADRIGHGLSIIEKPDLAQRFRDRDICLELCPTSNREVIGFFDPEIPESSGCEKFPLLKFLEQGLPLALCTDNPGISRTTLTDEFLRAARMTGGEITLWTALAIIKQGFLHAFLPKQNKEPLITRVDQQLYRIVHQEFAAMTIPVANR